MGKEVREQLPPEVRLKGNRRTRLGGSTLRLLLGVVMSLGLVLMAAGVVGGRGSQPGSGSPAAGVVPPPERDPFAVGAFSGREQPVPVAATATPSARNQALPQRDPFAVGQRGVGVPEGTEPEGASPGETTPATPPGGKAGSSPVGSPVASPAGSPVPGRVEVRVTTLDLCWLEVYVDGERVLRKNVPGGTTHTWVGEREVLLQQVGRERAVDLAVNGRDLGRLSALAPRLQGDPQTVETDGTRVKITLARRYRGGVLVGLKFAVQE